MGNTAQCLLMLENKGYGKKLMEPCTLQTLTLGPGVRFNWTHCIYIMKGKQHSTCKLLLKKEWSFCIFKSNKYTLKIKSLTHGFKITEQAFTDRMDSQYTSTEQTTSFFLFPEKKARTDSINSGTKTSFSLR